MYTRHISASLYWVMRSLGRVAFPLYSLLLVSGFEHTKSRRAYFERLTLFALISQLPYSLAMTKGNYSAAEYPNAFTLTQDKGFFPAFILATAIFLLFFADRKNLRLAALTAAAYLSAGFSAAVGELTVWSENLNVMYTLASAMAVLWLIELWREGKGDKRKLVLLSVTALALCVCILRRSDYGFMGLALVVMLCLCRKNKTALCLAMAVWCVCKYFPADGEKLCLTLGALLALVPCALYSGVQGRKSRLFYFVYPLHLMLYALAGIFLL